MSSGKSNEFKNLGTFDHKNEKTRRQNVFWGLLKRKRGHNNKKNE